MRALRRAADRIAGPSRRPAPSGRLATARSGVLVDRDWPEVARRPLGAAAVGTRGDGASGPARPGSRPGRRWVLRHRRRGRCAADGVVLAVPAAPAADLLAAHDAEAAALLRGIEYASVAVVTLRLPAPAPSPERTGGHRPARPPRHPGPGLARPGGRPFLVTACTYLVGQVAPPRPARRAAAAGLGRAVRRRPAGGARRRRAGGPGGGRARRSCSASTARPTASLVTRWPDALPQYRVHHLLRVTGIEAAVQPAPRPWPWPAPPTAAWASRPASPAGGRRPGRPRARRTGRRAGPRADGPGGGPAGPG